MSFELESPQSPLILVQGVPLLRALNICAGSLSKTCGCSNAIGFAFHFYTTFLSRLLCFLSGLGYPRELDNIDKEREADCVLTSRASSSQPTLSPQGEEVGSQPS